MSNAGSCFNRKIAFLVTKIFFYVGGRVSGGNKKKLGNGLLQRGALQLLIGRFSTPFADSFFCPKRVADLGETPLPPFTAKMRQLCDLILNYVFQVIITCWSKLLLAVWESSRYQHVVPRSTTSPSNSAKTSVSLIHNPFLIHANDGALQIVIHSFQLTARIPGFVFYANGHTYYDKKK